MKRLGVALLMLLLVLWGMHAMTLKNQTPAPTAAPAANQSLYSLGKEPITA